MTTVLLIEDDADLRGALFETLEDAGYTVLAASGGYQGLDILQREAVDMAVTDIVMAGGEGIEFILKAKAAHPSVPIVAMSAKAHYLKDAASLGADHILLKPFRLHELMAVLSPMR
ncbi:MAG: response regulator [Rhodospirillales bacterium]